MKTFVRLIRRYVLLAVGLTLLLIMLALALIVWIGVRFGLVWQEQFSYSYSEVADHLQQDGSGQFFFTERDAEYWLQGYEWAMVLDDDGRVIWQYRLPQELKREYTASEIERFPAGIWRITRCSVRCGTTDCWCWEHPRADCGSTISGRTRR